MSGVRVVDAVRMRHLVWPERHEFGPEATTPQSHPRLWLPWDEFVGSYCAHVGLDEDTARRDVPVRGFLTDTGNGDGEPARSEWSLAADVDAWYDRVFRHDPAANLAAGQRVDDAQ